MLERIKKDNLFVSVNYGDMDEFDPREDERLSQELIILAEIGQQMQWVSVKNGLPTTNGTYFTRYKDGRIGTGTFFLDVGRFNKSNSGGVVAWMLIPESDKVDGDVNICRHYGKTYQVGIDNGTKIMRCRSCDHVIFVEVTE